MNNTYKNFIDGKIVKSSFPLEILDAVILLKDDYEKYFHLSEEFIILPVSDLVLSHLRIDGTINANFLMHNAYNKTGEKRSPVSIKQLNSKEWLVIDGNSTIANAIMSKWDCVPCVKI